jgi:hypothetical protein
MCFFFFYLLGIEDGECRHAFLTHLTPLSSVSDVRNYLNVWSDSVTFTPPNIIIDVC